MMRELLNSKKFIVCISGMFALIVGKYLLHIDDATVTKLFGIIVGYLLSQGLADIGKEAAKINAEAPVNPDTIVTQVNK
jgi:hypothetical protein